MVILKPTYYELPQFLRRGRSWRFLHFLKKRAGERGLKTCDDVDNDFETLLNQGVTYSSILVNEENEMFYL